jgi:hypothetical protein
MTTTVPIFDVVQVGEASGAPERPFQPRGERELSVRVVEQGIEVLEQSMGTFLDAVNAMIAHSPEVTGGFEMDTVEVHAVIGGNGKIGFAGIGLQLQGSSSLKIVLRRRAARESGAAPDARP